MVSFVICSHSEKLALGIVEEAHMMAPDVVIIAAGGSDNGELGTSYTKISSAISEASNPDGVIILCDMGSAVLTAQLVLEDIEEDECRVVIADCPILEGAVMGTVLAESGDDLDSILDELSHVAEQKKLS